MSQAAWAIDMTLPPPGTDGPTRKTPSALSEGCQDEVRPLGGVEMTLESATLDE